MSLTYQFDLKVFRVLFRSTFQCMEASVLNVWRPVIYHNQLLDSCQGAIAKLRGGVGHKYRVRRAGGGVRHAAAPRNRRWLPYGVSRGGSSVKFKI